MEHITTIKDKDPYFEIDVNTRAIINKSTTKTAVMQFDHNSERFTFSVPRFIENHDMTECDSIAVHYINVDLTTNESLTGLYPITDIQIDPEDDSKVICTWLLSRNVTNQAGALSFLLRFQCIDNTGEVTYAWSTDIFKGISVSAGIDNSEEIYDEYIDVLEQWKRSLPKTNNLNFTNGEASNSIVQGITFSNWKASDYINALIAEYVNNEKQNENGLKIQLDKDGNVIAGAFGLGSATFGTKSQALGGKSFATGSKTVAFGNNTHTEGNGTFAVGQHSHAEGNGGSAIGNSSHVEGYTTRADDHASHAEGILSHAMGESSHAEGYNTQANGSYSHSEGRDTIANAPNSHAEGCNTHANAEQSHAEGHYTIIDSPAGHVQGRFNKLEDTDKYAHIVGNGTNERNRSNAHTVDWNGNAWYAGNVETTGVILTSPNGTRYMITVTDSGELTTQKVV